MKLRIPKWHQRHALEVILKANQPARWSSGIALQRVVISLSRICRPMYWISYYVLESTKTPIFVSSANVRQTFACELDELSRITGTLCHASGCSWNWARTCWAICCWQNARVFSQDKLRLVPSDDGSSYLLSWSCISCFHDTINQRYIYFFAEIQNGLDVEE
jgi:hypothetical protein